VTLCTIHFAIF
jgi:hypothetical protein